MKKSKRKKKKRKIKTQKSVMKRESYKKKNKLRILCFPYWPPSDEIQREVINRCKRKSPEGRNREEGNGKMNEQSLKHNRTTGQPCWRVIGRRHGACRPYRAAISVAGRVWRV